MKFKAMYSLECNFLVFKIFANLHLAFATNLEKKPNKGDQQVEKSKPAVEPREDVNPIIKEQNMVDYDYGKISCDLRNSIWTL